MTPEPTWFVHEDAVDEPTPMDITVRCRTADGREIVLCYMGPGVDGRIDTARLGAHWIARLLNENRSRN
jgi:hypothetical protein